MNRLSFAVPFVLASVLSPAHAVLPTGTLELVQRTGVVGPNDNIPIVVRLTLAADSTPLTFSSNPLTGFATEDIPTSGQFWNPETEQNEDREFASVTGAYLNTFYSCQGTFTDICGPSANYRFDFNLTDSAEHPSINFRESFELAPGASFEYTLGFFVPLAGGAAPGVYRWNGTGVTLSFRGLDAAGNSGDSFSAMTITSGNSLDPGVAFERTVVAIPEPSTYALMGLGIVALFARRRSALGT